MGHYGVSALSISQSRLQFLRFPSSKLSFYYAPRAKKHNVAKRFVKRCKYCACTSQGYDGESGLTISQPLLQSLRFLCSKLSPFRQGGWCEIECLVGAIVRSYRISDIFCVSVPKTNNENTLFCASILWQTEPKAHGSLRTQSPARPGIPPTQNLAGCQSHN